MQAKHSSRGSLKEIFAEFLAKSCLEGGGYKIIAERYTVKGGEIDIIAIDQNTLVFVECKYRHGANVGEFDSTISRKKAKCLEKAAERFLQENIEFTKTDFRFDLALISRLGVEEYIENICLNDAEF